MPTYQALAQTVIINRKNRLIHYDDSLQHVGTGRSAFVFQIKSTMTAIKVYFPAFAHLAKEETEIYEKLQDIAYYPTVYDSGSNYIVMDYIEGDTLFDCISRGKVITPAHMKTIDAALSLAVARNLNPSDIHLRNIFITYAGEIKIIDVARFRQTKECRQWQNLKKAYSTFYSKRLFPKKVPAPCLNMIAVLYKKGCLPLYRA
ncbi:serine/threonine protein kinase [Bacillus sp. OxB-1]|uniref:protein kinase domain-containing protein n=1 Tax=Bacillus sp. (strain OxB-1) TaxID=98228 RepID=UPI000581EAF0|nr:serine/threonine protein kinase [Bacillus sp. OxB-1]BAQ09560.1 serine/threonine protein kinase [Bacillus sp. OxB-1]